MFHESGGQLPIRSAQQKYFFATDPRDPSSHHPRSMHPVNLDGMKIEIITKDTWHNLLQLSCPHSSTTEPCKDCKGNQLPPLQTGSPLNSPCLPTPVESIISPVVSSASPSVYTSSEEDAAHTAGPVKRRRQTRSRQSPMGQSRRTRKDDSNTSEKALKERESRLLQTNQLKRLERLVDECRKIVELPAWGDNLSPQNQWTSKGLIHKKDQILSNVIILITELSQSASEQKSQIAEMSKRDDGQRAQITVLDTENKQIRNALQAAINLMGPEQVKELENSILKTSVPSPDSQRIKVESASRL